MAETGGRTRLADRWDEARASGMSEAEKLLYRSNLLGSDKRITNYGGGNTSAKIAERDPLTGESVEVLWVKGSGGDVGTMKRDGSLRSPWTSSGR
jgi:rhamnose utilization protein RhaD (predicted bifunctional aldolase and dehydrogenase)